MSGSRFSPRTSLGYLVNHAARLLERELAEQVRPHGAWPAYFPVLLALWEQDGRTQAELVRLVDVEQPTLANTLNRMERDGFVRRTLDPSDRRATCIRLTDHGRALEDTLTRGARGVNERALRGLDQAQRTALLATLRQVIENLRGGDG